MQHCILANYFRLPTCLLPLSGCPQTINGLAPIPKTQVLLVRQKGSSPQNLVYLPQTLSPPPLSKLATKSAAPLQSQLPTKYSRPWRSAGQCLPDYHDRLGGSNSPKSHPHTWNPSVGALFFCPRANLPYCSWCFTVTYERTMWQTQGFSCPLLWSLGSH